MLLQCAVVFSMLEDTHIMHSCETQNSVASIAHAA